MGKLLDISVKDRFRELAADFKAEEKVVRLAASAALNRAGSSVSTEAGRRIRKVYAIKADRLKGSIKTRKANPSFLIAKVVASGKHIPLGYFSAKINRRSGDVTVKVRRAGGRKRVTGKPQFIGRPTIPILSGGHIGVYQRKTKKRLPIKELFSIDVPRALTTDEIFKALSAKGADVFAQRFRHEMKRRTGSRKKV